MGTDLVPFEQYAVAQVDGAELVETIKANVGDADLNEGSLDRVRMPGAGSTTWSVPTLEGDVDTKALTGVIVFSKLVRAYWQTSYDDGDGNDVPDCASPDSQQAYPPGDFTPPAAPHDGGGFACATCELAKFGSGENGRGQACQQKRLVFMLGENDVLPFVVALAPTSLKAASDYLLRLTRAGLPYWKVGTSITLTRHDDPKPHARASFVKAFDLSPEQVAAVQSYREALLPVFQRTRLQDVEQG